jgi:hypothetical protein
MLPYNEINTEYKVNSSASRDCRKFEVRCDAGRAGHLQVASDSLSVRVGQRIRQEGKEELWGSLLVECKEQDDGSLTVDVVVCHPDWEEPLRIASLRSNPPVGKAGEQTLQFDFEQKQL